MFRNTQYKRMTASNVQIQNAGTNTVGNGLRPMARSTADAIPYITNGNSTTASGFNNNAARMLPCIN